MWFGRMSQRKVESGSMSWLYHTKSGSRQPLLCWDLRFLTCYIGVKSNPHTPEGSCSVPNHPHHAKIKPGLKFGVSLNRPGRSSLISTCGDRHGCRILGMWTDRTCRLLPGWLLGRAWPQTAYARISPGHVRSIAAPTAPWMGSGGAQDRAKRPPGP